MQRHARLLFLLLVGSLGLFVFAGHGAAADDWTITSFDVQVQVSRDARLTVIETIDADFGTLQKHGIFRIIPTRYAYDDKHERVIRIESLRVTQNNQVAKWSTSQEGSEYMIKIGEPNKTVTGRQRYVLQYEVVGAVNAQPEHDEVYWNATGNDAEVTIARATALVQASQVERATCFEGPTNSYSPCSIDAQTSTSVSFSATRRLPPGSGLTVVIATPQGALTVPPPMLVEIKSPMEAISDFMGFKSPAAVAAMTFVAIVGAVGVARLWWVNGRDRWYGDAQYLSGNTLEETKPLFSKDTILPEFAPPDIGAPPRRLRPAEMGVLVDERADTLDVTATIVDLAVRGYLRIVEVPKTWVFGKSDYRLEKLKQPDDALQPYERSLLVSLFAASDKVEMSDLRNNFYDDLARVKDQLYDQVVKSDGYFPRSPSSTRALFIGVGIGVIGLGVAAVAGLGALAGAGVIGIPLIVLGLAVVVLSQAMPRRTGAGREALRRSMGFREFMVTAETEHQRDVEQQGLFDQYLPYAIVFGITERWARAFRDLENQPSSTGGWYVSPNPFVPLTFVHSVNDFSTSMSKTITSTPASSGRSGFGGGGFSGGGFGGGSTGSW